MTRPPIETILYDLGNVILPFNNYQIAEKLSRAAQRKEFQDPQKLFSYLFDLQKGVINRFDAGKVSPREFFQSIKETIGLSLSFDEFVPSGAISLLKIKRFRRSFSPKRGDGSLAFSPTPIPSISITSFQNSLL